MATAAIHVVGLARDPTPSPHERNHIVLNIKLSAEPSEWFKKAYAKRAEHGDTLLHDTVVMSCAKHEAQSAVDYVKRAVADANVAANRLREASEREEADRAQRQREIVEEAAAVGRTLKF